MPRRLAAIAIHARRLKVLKKSGPAQEAAGRDDAGQRIPKDVAAKEVTPGAKRDGVPTSALCIG